MSLSPQLIVIDTVQGIRELKTYLEGFEAISFDMETTGLTKRDEIIGFSVCAEESKAFYVILAKYDKSLDKLVYLQLFDESKEIFELLKTKSLVAHNAVFDCMMIESQFKVSLVGSVHTDTLIMYHLLNENRSNALKELAKDLFGESATQEQIEMKASVLANGGQLTKDKYELFKADAYLIGKYGAKDALLTYKLFVKGIVELEEQGLYDFFYNDESMPLLRGPTYDLNTVGLMIDTQALAKLKKTLQAEALEDRAFIYKEIEAHIKDKYPDTNKKNRFNIDAPQQLSWLLFSKLGLEFTSLTKGGKIVAKALGLKQWSAAEKRNLVHSMERAKGSVYAPEGRNVKTGKVQKAKKVKDFWTYMTVDKTALKKYAPRYTWIARLQEYQKRTKLLKTYVLGIESGVNYGVIQPSFLQHGTTSGRYSSKKPNFQNLPKKDTRIKSCIMARPGKVFVSADFSQLEPRVFAYISGDKNLMKAFNGTDDFYSIIGMGVYNKTDCTSSKEELPDSFRVKYSNLRDSSKVIALASVYGASAWQLAKDTKKSVDDTQLDIDNYFESFPGVAKMMTDAHEKAKKDGFVTNIFGRPRRIPDAKRIGRLFPDVAHADLDYPDRKILNLAVNHPIQGTGASIVNRAMIAFNQGIKDRGLAAKIVSQIHDEIIVECDEAIGAEISVLLQLSMENTVTLDGVPLEAIPRITKTFAK